MITFKTSMGDFSIELDFEKAPITSANFLSYASEDYFNETVFHRVINGFMVQGGADSDMHQKNPKHPIENEADNGLENKIGTIAMARTSDPHSASTQAINVANNDFLNHSSKTMQGFGAMLYSARLLKVWMSLKKSKKFQRAVIWDIKMCL